MRRKWPVQLPSLVDAALCGPLGCAAGRPSCGASGASLGYAHTPPLPGPRAAGTSRGDLEVAQRVASATGYEGGIGAIRPRTTPCVTRVMVGAVVHGERAILGLWAVDAARAPSS